MVAVLTLPGWQNSGPKHWQSLWERAHGYQRVEQHDWSSPLRGDWIARLEEALLGCAEPAFLVAHSLGCIQVAAWAAHSKNTGLVRAALLAAPLDTERDSLRQMLGGWSPIPQQTLPFKALVFSASNDPFCSPLRARMFAKAWGATHVEAGSGAHLNEDSSLGDWAEGHAHLLGLMARSADKTASGVF